MAPAPRSSSHCSRAGACRGSRDRARAIHAPLSTNVASPCRIKSRRERCRAQRTCVLANRPRWQPVLPPVARARPCELRRAPAPPRCAPSGRQPCAARQALLFGGKPEVFSMYVTLIPLLTYVNVCPRVPATGRHTCLPCGGSRTGKPTWPLGANRPLGRDSGEILGRRPKLCYDDLVTPGYHLSPRRTAATRFPCPIVRLSWSPRPVSAGR